MTDAFTFGIEEEYFLVDAETKFVNRKMPDGFLAAAKKATEEIPIPKIVDLEDGKVVYAEQVKEVASEPNYEAAMKALKGAL